MSVESGIPVGWDYKAVEDLKSPDARSLAAGPFGSSISSKFFVEEGVPVIRGGNLSLGKERFIANGFAFITPAKADEFKGAQVKAGDLVFTCWGTLGQVGIIPEDGPFPVYVISNKQLKFRPDPSKASAHFLYYYFASPSLRQRFNDVAVGAAVPGINLGILRREKVPLPKLAEQKKIAAILTAYDDLIENNRQRIALLEKMAEEIYREWFVRLRFPGHEYTPVHKGVPEGWEPTSLFDLCRLKRGYDLPKQNVVEGKYPILAATGIAGFHNEYKAEAPVVTTGRSGSLGAVVWSSEPAWPLNTSLYLADSKGNSKHFLFFTLKSANLAQFNSGAGVPTLNRNHLSCVKVLRPSEDIQARFDQVVAPIREQTDTLQRSINLLGETRDLLLNRLISGKLRVDELDIQFPPSMQEKAA